MNLTVLSAVGAGALTLALLYLVYGWRQSLEGFLVAERRIPYQFAGTWMAIAFVWGTTFFFVSQLSYQ